MSKVKQEFLEFPIKEFCTSIMSIGPPGSGKTFIVLGCLRWWILHNVFDEYHLVLPTFKNEQNDSYGFLKTMIKTSKNIYIYETFSTTMMEKLVNRALKSCDLFEKGKSKSKLKFFFMCDDATSQGSLMDSPPVVQAVTENRHLQIHSWFLMHQDKKVIEKKVRSNFKFFYIYPVHPQKLRDLYENYVNFPLDFENYKEFFEMWKEQVLEKKHGCLFIYDRFYYSTVADTWFDNKKKPIKE